ncbi:YbfB/YjiJ family MFS transporter [Labrenzia sp. CE80]|uniref:YbfB/YjiJ family MFS transporter n=1 Tax=Labrenzia sp. CE80 TaxID=1788986 RepID=UPI001AD8A948|nr:YbfB/YjiJ family MFS transporter [Labrenzia sp. CE80]
MPLHFPLHLRLAMGGLLSLAAAMGIGRFVYTPILPFMAEAVPLAPREAGLVAAANFLGYLIGALAGSFGHLPGSKRNWLLGALFASVLTSGAMALNAGLIGFCLFRFAGGFASAFAMVFSSTLVLDGLTRAGKSGFASLHFAGVGCGIALSALLISGLSHAGSDWQGLWLSAAGATLILLLAIVLLLPTELPETSQGSQDTKELTEPDRFPDALWRLIAAYGLFGFGYVVTATFISVIVRADAGLSGLEELVWLIVGLTAAPSIWFWSRIGARTGAATAFSIACLVEAVGVTLSVSGGGLVLMVLAAALLGATFMGITALGLMEARKLTTGDPRRILALMTASFGLGQVIGPWFAGALYDLSGNFQAASLAAAGALVLAAALGYRGRNSEVSRD